MTKLTKAEQEVNIVKYGDETGYCAYITDPAELPHHLGLAKKVGGRVIQHQGGTKIFYPQDSVLLQVIKKAEAEPGAESRTRPTDERSAGHYHGVRG